MLATDSWMGAAGVLVCACVLALVPAGHAQQLQPPATADFGQWETLAFQPRAAGPLSPDGQWLAYGVNRSNRNNELRIANVSTGDTAVAAFGDRPVFSADSQWLAYGVALSESEEEKLRKAKKPLHRSMGIRHLLSGETVVVESIETFAFSASGSHLALKRYAPEPPDGREPDKTDEDAVKAGSTLVVRRLNTGRDTTFGNVSEYVWQSAGDVLAFAISAEGKTGNGVQVFDAESGNLRVLDSAAASFTGLSWRKDAGDLVVLRSKSDPGREGPTQLILAWTGLKDGVGQARIYDPTSTQNGLGGSRRIQAARLPSWSDDGLKVFVGYLNGESDSRLGIAPLPQMTPLP